MLISDLLVKIGVDADVSKVKQFEAGITKVTKVVAAAGAALAGMAGGLTAFVQKSLEGLDEIAQLSRVTGEATDNIQLLGNIAETAGSSFQASNSSIEGLSRTIGEAANGVGLGARAFENYGLSAKKANGDIKSASEVMEELREKMRGMSEQQQIAMLAKLGIDKSMIQVLRMTNEEMAEARKNAEALTLGTGSQEGADEAAALQDSLQEVSQVVRAVSEFVALRLSPAIREVVEIFKKWFVVNNDIIKENLAGFANTIGGLLRFLGQFIKALDNVISSTIGWKVVLVGFATAVGIAFAPMIKAFLIANSTLLLIGAAITAVVFLFDDLLTEMEGGESLLGEYWQPLIKGIRAVQEALKVFTPAFEAAQTVIKDAWELIKAIFTGDTEEINKKLEKFGEDIGKYFQEVGNLIKKPFEMAFNWISNKFNELIKPVLDGIKTAGEYFGFGGEEKSEEEIQDNIREGVAKVDLPGKKKADEEIIKNDFDDKGTSIESKKGFFGWDLFGAVNQVSNSAKSFNPESIANKPKAGATMQKTENKTNTNNVTTNISVTGVSNPEETATAVSDASGRIVKNVESLQAI